ncbi:hypothetical protein CAPTEDRAFT_181312 [Capitella teleta]|uniref:Amino acid permease/ SLC12A domain-containing protein n=1 Tax=Capitella teleta TaxID=283909 RepID=R7T7E0_CAPTE|nr:hypothetical protein CAPTEDRAFT_181312 [Capitella teleta]|eukprot:ELT89564.1 hypothetical protein CAPTEDRAFT_181312 [Capitella teleta]
MDTIKLKRSVGLFSACGLIIGVIVGSGIFVSPKGVLSESGSVGMALVVWTLTGLICLVGALCLAELGCCISSSGGMYAYIRAAFGDLCGFLYLWTSVLIVFPAANAVIALTFAYYILYPFFLGCEPPLVSIKIMAAAAIALLTFLNCASVVWAARVQNVFAIIKTLALVVIIITGFVVLARGGYTKFESAFEGTETHPGKISLAFYSGLFSYSGWSVYTLNFLTEEIQDPYKNMPRAIWISMPLTTIIYVMANVAYFAALTPAEILESSAVAVTLSDRFFGVMSWCMPIFVAFSTFGSLNGSILSVARVFFVGARHGQMPEVLSLVHISRFTPMPAVLLDGVLSLIFVASDDVFVLINYVSFTEAFSFFACVSAQLYLRYKFPEMKRPLKVHISLPIFFFIVCLALLVFPIYQAPYQTGVGIAIMLSGIPAYWIGVLWTKPKAFTRMMDNFTRLCQKVLYSVPEEEKLD